MQARRSGIRAFGAGCGFPVYSIHMSLLVWLISLPLWNDTDSVCYRLLSLYLLSFDNVELGRHNKVIKVIRKPYIEQKLRLGEAAELSYPQILFEKVVWTSGWLEAVYASL
jgi:hypothetical protein